MCLPTQPKSDVYAAERTKLIMAITLHIVAKYIWWQL